MKKPILFQTGMTLIFGIILLLILTLLGISVMTTSTLQEKTTQNLKDLSSAFNAAEAALGDGEKWLASQTEPPIAVGSCAKSPCRVWNLNAIQIKNTDEWWAQNGFRLSSNDFRGVYSQPYYLIEEYSAIKKGNGSYRCYRVNARGVGTTKTAVVNLQSIYCIQF